MLNIISEAFDLEKVLNMLGFVPPAPSNNVTIVIAVEDEETHDDTPEDVLDITSYTFSVGIDTAYEADFELTGNVSLVEYTKQVRDPDVYHAVLQLTKNDAPWLTLNLVKVVQEDDVVVTVAAKFQSTPLNVVFVADKDNDDWMDESFCRDLARKLGLL